MKIKVFTVTTSLLLALSACSKKKSDDDDSSAKADYKGATTALATVADKMVPASLETDSTGLRLQDDNPCADTNGFFDCQPNLIRLYLGMGKEMVTQVNAIMDAMKEVVGTIAVGKDSIDIEDGDGVSKIDYDVTSAKKFKLLMHADAGPFIYFSANNGQYDMTLDSANVPDAEGAGAAKVSTSINYTDENNFDVTVKIGGMECSDDDIRAPQNIVIKISTVDGVWQGKAMLYMPRWLTADGATCAGTTVTDAMKMFMYTDFVGDDTNSTAALYLASSSLTSVDAIDTWKVSSFCSNFPSGCSGGYGFGDSSPVSSYQNNFCVTSTTATWNTSCTSTNTKIAAGTFGAAADWLLPTALSDLNIEMPSSL